MPGMPMTDPWGRLYIFSHMSNEKKGLPWLFTGKSAIIKGVIIYNWVYIYI